jgi:hypothetical protein
MDIYGQRKTTKQKTLRKPSPPQKQSEPSHICAKQFAPLSLRKP